MARPREEGADAARAGAAEEAAGAIASGLAAGDRRETEKMKGATARSVLRGPRPQW